MSVLNIWEGIYSTFKDVPSIGKGFKSRKWLERSENTLKNLLESGKGFSFSYSLLPVVVAMVASQIKQIRCLDSGGGFRGHYLGVHESLCFDNELDCTIVEGEKSCDIARQYLSGHNNLHIQDYFLKNKTFNIAYISSVIQYIYDWKIIIKKLIFSKFNKQ